jgi:hypothetical protein
MGRAMPIWLWVVCAVSFSGNVSAQRSDGDSMADALSSMASRLKPTLSAQGWTYFGRAGNDQAVWLQLPARKREAGLLSTWAMYTRVSPTKAGTLKPYLSSKALFWLDCKERTYAETGEVYYSGEGGGGEVVYSSPSRFDRAALQDVVPGSVAAAVLTEACGS